MIILNVFQLAIQNDKEDNKDKQDQERSYKEHDVEMTMIIEFSLILITYFNFNLFQ